MPGYKQTDMGVIPEGWCIRAVFEIAGYQKERFDDGDWIESEHITNGGYRIVQTGNIGIGKFIEKESRKYIYESSFDKLKCKELIPGDLLICRLAEPAGRACILPDLGETKVVTAVDVTIFRPSEIDSDRRYLAQYFSTAKWFESVLEQVGGTTHKRISRSALGNIKVPLPSNLNEQRAIAAALSDMDALLDGLDRLIAKKRAIKKATMQQLLTGQSRLPGFSGEWNVKLLGDVAEVKTGPFGSLLHERDYVSDGVPIITVEHLGEFGVEHVNLPMVSEADCKRLNAYSLHVGDIVFSRVGSVDRNALIRKLEDGWLFSGRLLRVRPNESCINSIFLSYQFHSEKFKLAVRTVAVGQTMASLNTRILNGIQVNLPSISEQTAIATILSDMDAEITVLETRRIKTRALKQAMMQELLTGRTRLI